MQCEAGLTVIIVQKMSSHYTIFYAHYPIFSPILFRYRGVGASEAKIVQPDCTILKIVQPDCTILPTIVYDVPSCENRSIKYRIINLSHRAISCTILSQNLRLCHTGAIFTTNSTKSTKSTKNPITDGVFNEIVVARHAQLNRFLR